MQTWPGCSGCSADLPCTMQDNPFADMGKLMENVKKAQELVKVEGARVQEELAKCAHVWQAVYSALLCWTACRQCAASLHCDAEFVTPERSLKATQMMSSCG